jgi:hypothetical protein
MSRPQPAIASIPSRAHRGIVLRGVEVQRGSPGGWVRARVRLERPGRGFYIGAAEISDSRFADLQCAAQATLQALEHAVSDLAVVLFELREAEAFEASGQGVIMVSLTATIGEVNHALVGFSPMIADAATSTARAVLDATNRLLGIG